MRVGFIKQLLWERYGRVWLNLVQDIDADVIAPNTADVLRHYETPSASEVSGVQFRLAVAEALALTQADLLLVPDLNAGESVARGGGQDPWIASFPETLQRLAGLPPVLKVPVTLDEKTLVLETLMAFKRDPAGVRRIWERNLPNLKPRRYPEPRWTRPSGQTETAGLLGQPWLLTQQLVSSLALPETHLVSQAQFNPSLLREEAKRLEQRLTASDAETLGAAHFFNRKGSVDKLVMVVDTSSGADLWLEKQVRKIASKPLEVVTLQDVIALHGIGSLLVSS